MMLIVTYVCLLWLSYVTATYDLNVHELQWLADHLEVTDCRKLVESLHMTTFQLEHELTGEDEPKLSCLNLLLKWDKEEGRGKNYESISLRLHEMGFKEVADEFSDMVLKEMDRQLDDAFLNDPFKKFIHKDSPLLEEAPRSFPTGHTEPIVTPWNWQKIIGVTSLIVMLVSALGVIAFHVIYRLDPVDGYVRRERFRTEEETLDYWNAGLLEQEALNEQAKLRGEPVRLGVVVPPSIEHGKFTPSKLQVVAI